VEAGVLEVVLVEAELLRVRAHIGERDPRRLLHHVTKLAGQDEPVLALHLGRLDEQDVAARPGDRQTGGHSGNRCSLGRLLEEALSPEGIADCCLVDRDRRLPGARRDRRGDLPQQFAELALELANAGLAVTGTGGDVLFVEATKMPGKDGLVLTGQLGDVMKESARIALSYVRSHAEELGLDEHVFEDASFHVHVPAGAIPKDGPSAGITMTTALASLLTGRPVKHTVGMTGEVTLQGRVLPIGGLKQKALAAHAAGLTDVIIPERNRADLDDVPEDVRNEMSFHPVMSLDEVLELSLEPHSAHALS
jgi:hypothetical protein